MTKFLFDNFSFLPYDCLLSVIYELHFTILRLSSWNMAFFWNMAPYFLSNFLDRFTVFEPLNFRFFDVFFDVTIQDKGFKFLDVFYKCFIAVFISQNFRGSLNLDFLIVGDLSDWKYLIKWLKKFFLKFFILTFTENEWQGKNKW